MNTNQPSTVSTVSIEENKPDMAKCEVHLQPSQIPLAKLPETTAPIIPKKCGILRKKTPPSKQPLQRSKTEISIKIDSNENSQPNQTEVNDCGKLSKCTIKTSKIKTPMASVFGQRSKLPAEVIGHHARCILPAQKKSKINLELKPKKKLIQSESEKLNSAGSWTTSPGSVMKLFSISTGAMDSTPRPIKAIHNLPSNMLRNNAISLTTQLDQLQKAVIKQQKLLAQAHKEYAQKFEDMEKFRKKYSDAKVLVGFEFVSVMGPEGEAVEPIRAKETKQMTDKRLNEQFKVANQNVLGYVQEEMKTIIDSYVNMCQELIATFTTMELKDDSSEGSENFRNLVNSSVQRLNDMKLDQGAKLSKFLVDMQSLMLTSPSDSGQELIAQTEASNAQQIQRLDDVNKELRSQLLAAEQQNQILKKTKTNIETNREKTLKQDIAKHEKDIVKWIEKYKGLDILNKKKDRELTEMIAKINEKNSEAQQIAKILTETDEQLANSTQQCKHLSDQHAELKPLHDQIISEHEAKLFAEREEKQKLQTALIAAKELIEQLRQPSAELSANGAGEFSCGDVSSATVPNIESHQRVVNQMKVQILQLVQQQERILAESKSAKIVVKTLEINLSKSDQKVQQKNAIIFKLENQLHEKTKRLSNTGAMMQAEIVQLQRALEHGQVELTTLRTQLLHAEDELRQKEETIGMNKRLLRIRHELLELHDRRDNTNASTAQYKWHDQCDFEISARSEEFGNLFSTLSHKQIAVTQQHLIIQRLEEHHARNACARAKLVERFKELETENAQLRAQLMACNGKSSSTETLQNCIEYNMDDQFDRNEIYLNDRRLKRRSKIIIK